MQNKYIRPRFVKKCSRCSGDFESKKAKSKICPDCLNNPYDSSRRRNDSSRRIKKLWNKRDNKKFLFKWFRSRMFGNNYKLTKLDEEIIRTRVRLFKIQRKEEKTDETNRI